MAGFKREVALLALPVLSFLGVIVVHVIHANPATSAWVVAACVAAGTVLTAALAKPIHPTILGGAVVALFTLLAHYWWQWSQADISQVVIIINLLFGIGLSQRLTPVPALGPAPAQPAAQHPAV